MIPNMVLLNMAGVASTMPLMAVLTNPELVDTNELLNKAFTARHNVSIDTNDWRRRGKLKAQGTFDVLPQANERFRAMVVEIDPGLKCQFDQSVG